MKPSTRILLVGDADQLPSVGPGNVFKNIIESNAVPVVTLKTIFRQAQASSIVKDAHLINKSIAPSNMRNVTVNKDGSSLELVGESLVSESDHTKGDVLYFSENDAERAIDVIEGPLINFIREQGYNIQSDVQFLANDARALWHKQHMPSSTRCNSWHKWQSGSKTTLKI